MPTADYNEPVVYSPNGTMTGTSTLTGNGILVAGCKTISFHNSWTLAPTGSFSYDFSNDTTTVASGVSTWTALTVPSAFTANDPAGTGSSSGNGFVDYEYRWIRQKYTNMTSTGALTTNVEMKA